MSSAGHGREHQEVPMSTVAPEGEQLKKAVRWLAERRQEDPKAPRAKLIEEAGAKYDLTPLQLQYLYDHWR